MIKLLVVVVLSINLYSYTNEDWKVYNGCKDKVYENKSNEYDYNACKEMLNHKSALKKYGAESSYNYWMKKLNHKDVSSECSYIGKYGPDTSADEAWYNDNCM